MELVEGCTLSCSFCGINAIRAKPGGFKYLSDETADRIVSEVDRAGWTPRIEFAMHGEPSQHPRAVEIIRKFRDGLPWASLMMTSNGSGFLGPRVDRVHELFRAGLNVLALDHYQGVDFVPKVLAGLAERHPSITVRRYPEDRGASVHQKRKPHVHEVVVLADISVTALGNHSLLSNHAGQAAPPDRSSNAKRCALPFREMSIRWDGNVALCCDDFRGTFKIGNVNETPIDALWQHPRFQAARRKLYHGQRDFGVCDGCTSISYRVGLLPDPTGRDSLPEPTERDAEILAEAVSGEPYSPVVLRPWEATR